MKTRDDTRGVHKGDVERYVTSTLHVPLALVPWPGDSTLPPYLRQKYRFYEDALFGTPVLWAFAEDPDLTPKQLGKHAAALGEWWPGGIVFAFGHLASYDRQRLIQYGTNFVVPGTQLYLPYLGVDFRSRTPRARRLFDTVLRPSAQVLLLHLLASEEDEPRTAAEIAPVLDYSKMTMARAVSQLEEAQLIEVARTGRGNDFRLAGPRSDIWQAAQDRLISPVARRQRVPFGWEGSEPYAGLTALAEYTMLAAPAVPVRAVSHVRFGALQAPPEDGGREHALEAREEDEVNIEVWIYEPKVLVDGPVVDRLSLYLSLRDDPDERVQGALEDLLQGLPW